MTDPRLTAERPDAWYVVLAVADSRPLYEGDSLVAAARAWCPGSTYGAGADADEAWEWALASAEAMRAAGYRGPNGRAKE